MATSIFDTQETDETHTRVSAAPSPAKLMLDCRACRMLRSMSATHVFRFPMILRIIGIFFMIPSVLGFLIAAFSLIGGMAASVNAPHSSPGSTDFAGLGLAMGVMFAVWLAVASLIMSTVGWIFLMHRNVWKCLNCGYFIDRG